MKPHVLTVKCPIRRGIVAAVSTYLAASGCALHDSSQFDDVETGNFFMRLSFVSEEGKSFDEIAEGFAATAAEWEMEYAFHAAEYRMKTIIMVSRFGHCLNDLLYRWKLGVLPIDIVAVVSNHTDYQELALTHGLPFHHLPVTKESKAQAEANLMQIVADNDVELIVLARYMQVLSDDLCNRMSGKIINIHHSFLPGFKGAKPYHQAHERGVKLIGATAHYVTAELDEGPIIEQEVKRVTHAQSPEDFVSIGREGGCSGLASAVHAHVHHRVFINGGKTIMFPPSPGSFASQRVG